jgi:Putative lumazine-binding
MATAQETDQITQVIDLYIEGCRDGDAGKLREAFHPEARMWGSLGGQRFDIPVTEMIAMVDGSPVDVEGSYKAQVTSTQQTDDAAEVVLAEEGFWGTVSFVDFFSLARIDGDWKIVNKTFVHTGGEPPAHSE